MNVFQGLKEYFFPSPILTADEFIKQSEEKERELYNSKEEVMKRLKLHKVPCRLTLNDLNSGIDSDAVKKKYRKLERFIEEREKFERDWK